MASLRLERAGSPTGWKRALFRAPIPLYRARLGFLFGKRLIMLCHIGRKTGDTRRTILEVVVNQPDAVYVAAGWGAKAQWLKNVRANPSVVVYLGATRFETTAEFVHADEKLDLIDLYAEKHPMALRKLALFMLDEPGDTTAEQTANVAESLPILRLPKRPAG